MRTYLFNIYSDINSNLVTPQIGNANTPFLAMKVLNLNAARHYMKSLAYFFY